MKAWLCKEFGPPESLVLEEVQDPVAGEGQVVVDVQAASVNFPDALIIQGKYQFQPPFPFSPGGEAAGTVSSVGPGVESVKPGDQVICMTGNGAFAEKVVAGAAGLIPLPEGMSAEKGASFSMVYGTSWYALKQRAQLKANETLLVLGAAGGVGYSAVELGKKVIGARVIAAASSDEKLEVARQAGADECVNYSDGKLKDKVKELTGGQGADVIYDPLGGDMFDQCMRCVNWNGRVLVIGFTAGIPKMPTNLALLKGCSVVGVFWGAFTGREKAANDENFRELGEFFARGQIDPPVHKVYPMAQAPAAIRLLADRKATGKVVVRISSVDRPQAGQIQAV